MLVSLTPSGRVAVQAAHEQVSAWRRRVFESLEPDEREQAAALLDPPEPGARGADAMKRQHYGLTLAVLAVAGLSFALLQTMVAPALPAIQREFGASTTAVTWVLTVYLLTASIATPVLGRLGDMFGKERLLVIVLLVLAAGTLICRALDLARDADRRPRRPGRRRRDLPARLRDHPRRVPARARRPPASA